MPYTQHRRTTILFTDLASPIFYSFLPRSLSHEFVPTMYFVLILFSWENRGFLVACSARGVSGNGSECVEQRGGTGKTSSAQSDCQIPPLGLPSSLSILPLQESCPNFPIIMRSLAFPRLPRLRKSGLPISGSH